MALSLVHLAYLRVFRPILVRLELAVTLVAELCNFATFALGMALLVGPSERDSFRCDSISGCLTLHPLQGDNPPWKCFSHAKLQSRRLRGLSDGRNMAPITQLAVFGAKLGYRCLEFQRDYTRPG